MSNATKISITVFVILFLAMAFYGYSIYRERNLTPIDNKFETIEPQQEKESDDLFETKESANSPSNEDEDQDIENEDSDEISEDTIEKDNFLDVFPQDCDNNCAGFKNDDLIYCQQRCGLSPKKKQSEEKKGCDAFSGMDRDYCFKDEAISKHETRICDNVEDPGIKKICMNRLAAYLIDQNQ